MAAWSEIKGRIVSLLGNRAVAIQDTDLINWFNQAQRNFAVRHTASQNEQSFDGDGSAIEFDLPADFLMAYAVYWNDEEMFLEPGDYKPGVSWDWESSDDTNRQYGYILWPASKLTVFRAPDEDTGNLKLYYWGLYADVVGDTSILEPPIWSHEALMFYTIALSLVPDLQDTAAIKQWMTRVDAGRPVDNPLLQAFREFMSQYETSLSLWPKQVRDQYFYPEGRN